jgi:hypothetical protein
MNENKTIKDAVQDIKDGKYVIKSFNDAKESETIKDAVKDIKGGKYIVRAFTATRESDLFMGNLEDYLRVIAVRLEAQNVMLKKYEQALEMFYEDAIKTKQELFAEMKKAMYES